MATFQFFLSYVIGFVCARARMCGFFFIDIGGF